MKKFNVTGYTLIRENLFLQDGETLIAGNKSSFQEFIKSLYHYLALDYPKFYKMDNLCKLAFIASEALIKKGKYREKYRDEEIGIILTNSTSSIDSDLKHVESIKDRSNYFPSPSVFVYTLPNIAVGEICIRNSIKGENALFISERFDVGFVTGYIRNLLEDEICKTVIGGRIEYSNEGYEACLFRVEEEEFDERLPINIPFDSEEIFSRIYNLNNK